MCVWPNSRMPGIMYVCILFSTPVESKDVVCAILSVG